MVYPFEVDPLLLPKEQGLVHHLPPNTKERGIAGMLACMEYFISTDFFSKGDICTARIKLFFLTASDR